MQNTTINSSKADISVIIPVYNCRFLPEAIDSVLAQTVLPSEIIVVDDGSDPAVRLSDRHRNHVKVFYQKNSGQGTARNNGVYHSKCDLIAFLDSDDIWHPRKIEEQLNAMLKNPELSCVSCRNILIDNEGKYTGVGPGNFSDSTSQISRIEFLRFSPLAILVPSMIMMMKSAFLKTPGFEKQFPVVEDLVFFDSLLKEFPVIIVEKPLLLRRMHGNNLTFKYRKMLNCYLKWINNRLEEECDKSLLIELTSLVYKINALSAYFLHKDADSRIMMKKSFKLFPELKTLFLFFLTVCGSNLGSIFRKIKREFSAGEPQKIMMRFNS
ncbi:MAG: glycosyltransferase [Candidatus Riflebacteria bacterium]|nr:glycosyltransferase [Candidatus Riflebacteria bacterium]